MLQKTLRNLLDLIYPPVCVACQQPIPDIHSKVCINCLLDLPVITSDTTQQSKVRQKFDGKINISNVNAYLLFEKGNVTQKLIYALKYRNKRNVGLWLGEKYADESENTDEWANFDAFVPIPLHPSKEKQRGYNQSLAISEGMALKSGTTVWADGLIKNKMNASQTRKGRYERYENASDIFMINSKYDFSEKHICLVDDVLTTGATLEAAALVLQAAGCEVSIKVIASAF